MKEKSSYVYGRGETGVKESLKAGADTVKAVSKPLYQNIKPIVDRRMQDALELRLRGKR